MRGRRALFAILLGVAMVSGLLPPFPALPAHAAVSLSTTTAYTQNFDSIGTSATASLPNYSRD
jgi:hypothetical protein